MGLRLTLIAKILYGALFVAVLPVLLVVFTARVELAFAIERFPLFGIATGLVGITIVAWGMLDIRIRGNGLPMNAFPPERLVVAGIFAVIPHPIYTGFALACLGTSMFFGSATGVFLTTPLVGLASAALAVGHERPYLLDTFGSVPRTLVGGLFRRIARGTGLKALAHLIMNGTERLANSWASVRIGPVRIINHAIFAGLAGGIGVFLVALASGRARVGTIVLLMLASIAGAAVIGQVMEGSSDRLSRPLGYFGGMLGIAIAGLVMTAFDHNAFVVLAAFAMAGPWTQAIGRLRCVVQGCCHGAVVRDGDEGIVIVNEHSRVASAGLSGQKIYPTQLYSIAGNVLIAALLLVLWTSGAALTLIAGLYLFLTGALRFVEEGYRGEPITPISAGLRIYQWFAIGMIITGAIVMTMDSAPAPAITLGDLWPALGFAAVFFVVCGIVAGVDLPQSRAKFSRLSG